MSLSRHRNAQLLNWRLYWMACVQFCLLLHSSERTCCVQAIGHLEVFKLLEPGTQLTRGGLASMLCKHAPTLIKLELNIPHEWHTRSRDLPPSTSPEMSAYLLNTFISQFKKLTQLTFNGPLASSAIFGVLPPAIEVLLWGYCPAIEPQRVAKLLNLPTKAGKRRLPKLRWCVSFHDRNNTTN